MCMGTLKFPWARVAKVCIWPRQLELAFSAFIWQLKRIAAISLAIVDHSTM